LKRRGGGALRIEYAAAALADLDQLTRYSALEFGVSAARNYALIIQSAIKRAAVFPGAGAVVGNGLVRVITAKSHRIFYHANEATLTVVRILRARQLPPGFE
jgi:plasmid stabilization system protein ParE